MFIKLNILKIFFEDPAREFNVREAARILGVSPATASKELKGMAKDGLLKERKERNLNLYRSDLESASYRDLKTYYNIRKLRESGLVDALNSFYLKPAIVLFGSAASGLDTKTSDFDLLIVSEKAKDFSGIKRFEKSINRPIQLFVVRNVKELKNEHLINSALNGIVVEGAVDGFERVL
ncbi:MAG: nucleotidyltransferase domain-containing protein [Candidatus Aenigmatarchaeota archaeon]